MIKSLEQYFIQFGHLDFPNVGSLKWNKKEANWQDGKLSAPVEEIVFDLQVTKPSKVFYNFLAEALNISNEQAVIQYEHFLQEFIVNDEPLAIGNLGILNKHNNIFTWETKFDATNYYADINLGTISLSENDIDKSHNLKKDNWILWAIFLLVIATVAILLKHL
jgi:hypothetical protein